MTQIKQLEIIFELIFEIVDQKWPKTENDMNRLKPTWKFATKIIFLYRKKFVRPKITQLEINPNLKWFNPKSKLNRILLTWI